MVDWIEYAKKTIATIEFLQAEVNYLRQKELALARLLGELGIAPEPGVSQMDQLRAYLHTTKEVDYAKSSCPEDLA